MYRRARSSIAEGTTITITITITITTGASASHTPPREYPDVAIEPPVAMRSALPLPLPLSPLSHSPPLPGHPPAATGYTDDNDWVSRVGVSDASVCRSLPPPRPPGGETGNRPKVPEPWTPIIPFGCSAWHTQKRSVQSISWCQTGDWTTNCLSLNGKHACKFGDACNSQRDSRLDSRLAGLGVASALPIGYTAW